MTTRPTHAHRVNVRCDNGEVTITLDGEVGPDAAELLDQATRAALETEGVDQVAVDLRKVERWTTDGFRALTRCAERHPNVRFRFGADTDGRPDGPVIPAA
ncbi:MAG: BON domain-containing protein [Acidimicrobiia bacterium]